MATVSHYAMRRYPVGPVDGSNQLGTNQYYVANSQRLSPMYDKSKKTWSQRLKISKTEKQLSSPLSELPDYSASALSRSMKYAEPWLYGTVRGIPARPVHGQALFAPLPAEVAVVVCSCPEYLNGTKKEVKKASICKKCKGSRLPLAPIGGTVRIRSTTAQVVHKPRGSAGTMRLPVSSSMKLRPTILDPQNDPYDLMRRSRLLSPEPKPVKVIEKAPRNRAKSTSPTRSSRSRTRNKPDDITKNGSNSNGNRNKQECWLETLDPDPGGRRSILHCDVNPYDLISGSKMHNNEFAPDNDDIFTNNHHHMSGTISRANKKPNYSNVKAIAGQRISLGKSTVQQALVNQNGESFMYEKEAENLRNNDQIPKDNEKTSTPKEQPKRPPRRKQESSADEESEASSQYNSLNPPPSAGSENLQTAGPMVDQVTSHKSGIKSILKRPSSVTSSMSSSSDIDTKSSSETRSDSTFSTKSDTARSGDGSAAAPIKGGDKLSSQFYLPLPTQITRKKVQFMVEDEIIQDEEEITFDGSQTQMGAQNPSIKENGVKSTINGMTPETRNLVLEAQQKQQQILQELLQLEQQQKHTAKNDLVSPVVVIVSGVNSPSVPVAEIQPNQADNIISVRHADSDKGHNGLTTITSCTDMNPDPSQLRKTFSLRRTHSDRRSNTTTVILNFNDTMALRAKNNRVDSRDIIFEDVPKLSTTRPKSPPPQPPTNPLTSTSSVRETTKKITSTDEELNGKDDGKALDICGSAGNQWKRGQVRVPNDNNSELGERLSQNQQNDKPQPSRPPRQPGKRISWQDYSHHDEDNEGSIMIKNEPINPSLTENVLNNDNPTNESVYESFSYQSETNVNAIPKSSSSGLKQSSESVQFVGNSSVKHQNSLKHNNSNSNRKEKQLLQAQKEIYHGTRLFGNQNKSSSHNQPHSQQNQQQQQQQLQHHHHHHHQQKQTHSQQHHHQQQQQHQRTVVRVAPFNKTAREVHRLKIKHEDTNGNCDNSLDQKKTSILINGDDCYSTVNVNNDTPLYQSSVVVTDGTTNTIASGNNLKVSSNTVTISVSNPHTPEEDLIYKNNKINTLLSLNSDNTGNTNNNQYGSSGASDSTARSVVPIGNNNVPVALSKATTVTPTASGLVSPSAKKLTSNDVNSTKRKRTLITLDYDNKSEKEHNLSVVSHEEELVKILRNPVEAVKRNLVPHVCGKTDTNSGAEQHNASQNLQKIEVSIMAHKDQLAATGNDGGGGSSAASIRYDRNSFIGKLLEDPTLNHLAEGLDGDVVAKLIENSLKRLKESRSTVDTTGTKDNDDMAKLIDMSLQKIKEERQKLEASKKPELTTSMPVGGDSIEKSSSDENQSNRGSISSGNSYGSANYELFEFENNESDCYQSCSSELTGEDDTVSTRSKFYQMLVDATLSEIEISTNNDDDHHYESIRLLNGDPIYEEISEVPPPLPLSPPPLNDNNMNGGSGDLDKKNTRSMFEGASKYDILSYLVDAKERGIVREETYEYNFSNTSDIIVEEEIDTLSDLNKKQTSNISSRLSHLSITSDSSEDTSLNSLITDKLGNLQHQRKTPASADIERNDSGVGSETSKTSRSKYQNGIQTGSIVNKNSPIHLCEDCDGPVETQITDHGVMYAPLVCRKCGKKRAERKEIITEIVETEEKYGRDLQIILEEFCQPMLVAGLLTQEQLSAIFLNTEELLENNQTLAERMRDTLDIAMEQGDDDLLTVNIGRIFLESTQMLHAFESYCVRQAAASLLLANLEKEKELLRIFLRVSQMENTVLRRMNLNSFLMVPVQRVTKYPLLLARLYKVTPAHLDGRELLKQAQEKIELHLNHMNQEAKDVPTKLWRRISSSSPNRRSSCEIDMINIKLRKMAIDVLEWNHDEVRFAMEGKLLFTQPTDSNWKKGRTIKLTPVNALLVTNGKPSANYKVEKALSDQLNFPKHTGIREASLLLVKEKCGRYTLIREPLYLDRCVVCTETDWDDYFEVQEILTKDTFIFKAEDGSRTKQWYAQIQYHAQGMGAWRKRRNALANIMINGMLSRT